MTRKTLVIGVIATITVGLGAYFAYEHFTFVSTDNAQVGAHVVMLSSRVNGTIQKVLVEENSKVKAGDTLAQVDVADLSNALEAAEAAVASLEARFKEAEVNYHRSVGLLRTQAISRERYDNAMAGFHDSEAKLKAAKAQLDQAKLNVSYTKITAPSDGMIARKSVEPGQWVPAGQPLFGFVATDERWVTANVKETDLDRVSIGRHVDVKVDAIPGRTFEGQVASISPSTGAVFSLLPPDNATGNFTKVVQRVSVRIKLVNIAANEIDRLQAGLSAVVDIRIR